MKDSKQIFILGLVIGMILVGMIIVFSFFLGNSFPGFDIILTKQEYAPYFKKKVKALYSFRENKPPYRIKQINREGKNFVYILEGGDKSQLNKNNMHPNKSPMKIAPLQ